MNVHVNRDLRHGDIVAVLRTTTSGPVVGQIDKIHWDTNPVWISLVDVDSGERCTAQLQHVIGRLQNIDPAPRVAHEPPPRPKPPVELPGVGVVLAD
jgi:hypothetical protein